MRMKGTKGKERVHERKGRKKKRKGKERKEEIPG